MNLTRPPRSDAVGAIDWLDLLCRSLTRMDLIVVAARSSGGEVALRLELSDGGPELEVTFSREQEGPSLAIIDGIVVRFRGQVGPRGHHALAVLTRLVRGLSRRVPAELASPTLIGLEAMAPHDALAFGFPFCRAERSRGPAGDERVEEVLVRLTGRCNQACPFCSAPLLRPDPTAAEVARLLDRLELWALTATLTFTGGEPTLRRELPALVERALRSGRTVEIQTNAVRLADSALVDDFDRSSRLRFFVSLHSLDGAVYDRCTGTRGMLPRAIAGIRNLLVRGHEVVLSCVATSLNWDRLESLVDGIAATFSGLPAPAVHFSITLCPEHRPEAASFLVRYGELAPRLEAAFERAERHGLRPEPLISSSHAAIPPCTLSPRHRDRRGPLPVLAQGVGEGDESRPGWIRGAACMVCALHATCLGVPTAYAERFGLDEFRSGLF